MPITVADIREAEVRISPWTHRTPVMTCHALDEMAGAELFLKCENLQRTGSFKARGAFNAVFSLGESESRNGVVGTSSGNHAAALALAARCRGIPCTVVMHNSAPPVKIDAVRGYGAEIVAVAPFEAARREALAGVVERTGAVEIHPSDDDLVIAGAGTAALELLQEVPGLEMIVGPIGGGGLMSGTAIAAHGSRPQIRVVGAEPELADDAARSLCDGRIHPAPDPALTIADGLLTSLSERTFAVLGKHLEGIVTVTEKEIAEAMFAVWTRAKLVIEPSAAVPVAALLKSELRARRVGVILSGGNADPTRLPWSG